MGTTSSCVGERIGTSTASSRLPKANDIHHVQRTAAVSPAFAHRDEGDDIKEFPILPQENSAQKEEGVKTADDMDRFSIRWEQTANDDGGAMRAGLILQFGSACTWSLPCEGRDSVENLVTWLTAWSTYLDEWDTTWKVRLRGSSVAWPMQNFFSECVKLPNFSIQVSVSAKNGTMQFFWQSGTHELGATVTLNDAASVESTADAIRATLVQVRTHSLASSSLLNHSLPKPDVDLSAASPS